MQHRRPSVVEVSTAFKSFINQHAPNFTGTVPQIPAIPNVSVIEAEEDPDGEDVSMAEAPMDDSGLHNTPAHGPSASPSPPMRSTSSWRSASPGRWDSSSPRPVSPMSTHSSPGCDRKRSYACPECNKLFSNSSNMTRHRRIHTGDRPYLCEHCSLAFGNSSNRRKHERSCKLRPHTCISPATSAATPVAMMVPTMQ